MPIGKSLPAHINEQGELAISGMRTTSQYIFQSLSPFRPTISADTDGLYLFWKIEEVKPHVPKFNDPGVKAQVLRTWKMIKARDLALKEAKSLADAAQKAGKPLREFFADRPNLRVVLPPKFSWMSFPNTASLQAAPFARLSSVAGVEMPGDDFMQTVFSLKKSGQTAVALNAPKNMAYVVQVTDFSPSYEARKTLFEVDDFQKYASVARARSTENARRLAQTNRRVDRLPLDAGQ